MLRDLLLNTLPTAGYYTVRLEAWIKLEGIDESEKPITDTFQLIFSDIEMLQMAGHHLILRSKNIRISRIYPS